MVARKFHGVYIYIEREVIHFLKILNVTCEASSRGAGSDLSQLDLCGSETKLPEYSRFFRAL